VRQAKENLDALKNDEKQILIRLNKQKGNNGKTSGKGTGTYTETDKDW
jgi:hypothetical protein